MARKRHQVELVHSSHMSCEASLRASDATHSILHGCCVFIATTFLIGCTAKKPPDSEFRYVHLPPVVDQRMIGHVEITQMPHLANEQRFASHVWEITTPAQPIGNLAIKYPPAEKRAWHEGIVEFTLFVDPEGIPVSINVVNEAAYYRDKSEPIPSYFGQSISLGTKEWRFKMPTFPKGKKYAAIHFKASFTVTEEN